MTSSGSYPEQSGFDSRDPHPLMSVLYCSERQHVWDNDTDWPMCVYCFKSQLFLEMIEEIIHLSLGVFMAYGLERVDNAAKM